MFNVIQQKKLDAFCAIAYHEPRLAKLKHSDQITDILALTVPVFYFVFRLLFKGTLYERPIEIIWELLAAGLLAMSVAKSKYGWADKITQHSRQIADNLRLISQADYMLSQDSLTTQDAHLFTLLADQIEKADRELLGPIPKAEEMTVYRESLKRFGPDIRCPICHASPFNYTPGTCQTCGNIPNQCLTAPTTATPLKGPS